MNRKNPRINLCSSHLISTNNRMHLNKHTHNETTINNTITKTTTHHNNYTLREGVAKNLEDKVVEEDLVGEEVQLHAITVDN